MTDTPEMPQEPASRNIALRWALVIAASILLLFALGVLTGIIVAILEHDHITMKDAALILGGLLFAGGAAFWLWSLRPFGGAAEPISNTTRLSRRYIGVSMILGAILGLGIALTGGVDGGMGELYSNGPIAKTPALLISVGYLIGLPLVGWFWHRSIDEHEAAANSKGALAGIYAYCMIAPVWWMGERADILPPQQPMVVFVIVLIVWGAVWTYKRAG